MLGYSSPKKNTEAKVPSWKKEMPQLLWTRGGKGDVQQWITEEQERVRDFKKHEFCLMVDGKGRMQWEVTQKKTMKLPVTRKIHYRVTKMWKLNMIRSWEGGHGCLYPDLQLDYVTKKFKISFLDLVTFIPVVHWGFSGFLRANIHQCIYSGSEKNYRSWQKSPCFPPSFKSEEVLHILYFSKV